MTNIINIKDRQKKKAKIYPDDFVETVIIPKSMLERYIKISEERIDLLEKILLYKTVIISFGLALLVNIILLVFGI